MWTRRQDQSEEGAEQDRFSIEVSPCAKYIQCCVFESLDSASLSELLSKLAAVAERHQINKFYTDFRQAPTQVSTVGSYELAHIRSVSLGFKPGSKHALVIAPIQTEIDHYRFTETVWANAGHSLQAFTDPDEALSWLKQ